MIVCPYKDLGRYAPIVPGLEEAMKAVAEMKEWTPGVIPLSGGNRILVQEITTTEAGSKSCEAHRAYLDIQCILEGEEAVGWAPVDSLTPDGAFDAEKDVGFYTGAVDYMRIGEGNCYVVFPEDAHMPGVHLDKARTIKKLVIKLKV